MTPLSTPPADLEFIRDFAAFCRTKGDVVYDFTDAQACALGQFGHPDLSCWEIKAQFPAGVFEAVIGNHRPSEWTFSALADRLEALLVDAPVEVSGRLGLSADRAGGLRPEPFGLGPEGRSSTGAGDAA